MEQARNNFLRNYSSILLLLSGIALGTGVGLIFPEWTGWLKPLGDIFLNLIFVSVVPLLFFAIASSVANLSPSQRLGKTLFAMSGVFLTFIVTAAVSTIVAVWLFPVDQEFVPSAEAPSAIIEEVESADAQVWTSRITQFVTVDDFFKLLSRQNMLAFVIFSFMMGIAARRSGDSGQVFRQFLSSANEVLKQLLLIIMKMAPVGLGAYFAYQVASIGDGLFELYAKPLALYYILGALFYLIAYSAGAYLARGKMGFKTYWKHNIEPSLTALGTCSSMATMPVNIQAARRMGIPPGVANVVIPLGTTLHKNGSSISSIVKIYVAFTIIGWNFFEPTTLITAVGITILVSIVAGGIPNGGYIGEILMISVYGLPAEAIPAVMIIGTLVDPMATLLNATGDTVAAMVTAKLVKQDPDEAVVHEDSPLEIIS
jgi:Na+/H+-dicarboxylate symporter